MDLIITQVLEIARTADETTRKALIDTLRNLSISLEEPGDTIQRLAYLPTQLSIAQVATDLNLWTVLSHSDNVMSVEDLAKVVDADPLLLKRLLRYLASFQMVKEDKENTFSASNVTRALATPGAQASIHHHFGMNPVLQELPGFLSETGYKNLTDPTDTPFQRAFKTQKTPFQWVQDYPLKMKHFAQWMAVQRQGMPTWLTLYPLEAECEGSNAEVLFVDVGGGVGHQCTALKGAFPRLSGRVILQDLPQVLEHAIPTEGVEAMAHDFFSPQPIKGARYYYLRNILHDYPDEKCHIILGQLLKAMDKTSSIILIDEMVLPDYGAPWQATQLDMTVMSALAAIERTRKEWLELFESAGLKSVGMYTYTNSLQDTIIALVPGRRD